MSDQEPEDYAVGFSQFLNLKIDLSKKPLIPRAETEYWADLAIKEIKNRIVVEGLTNVNVLDIFAGSGCVGLAVLKNVPEAAVDFAEIEPRFLEQTQFNAVLNGISAGRYELIRSDVFDSILVDTTYDFILANPPYIPEGRKGELDRSVVDYEPHGALFSGVDGLDLIKVFLAQAKKYLNKNGQIWLEFDTDQKEVLKELLPQYGYQNFTFHRDQYNRWRYGIIKK